MLTIYGLKNCDTCRKALKWLKSEGIEHVFKDVRKDGVNLALVTKWEASVGWETLLNRRGTTWRGLPDSDRGSIDQGRAIRLMVDHPALIKRPVFEHSDAVFVGFKDADKEQLR